MLKHTHRLIAIELDAMLSNGPRAITAGEIAQRAGVCERLARQALGVMTQRGMITRTLEKPGQPYIYRSESAATSG